MSGLNINQLSEFNESTSVREFDGEKPIKYILQNDLQTISSGRYGVGSTPDTEAELGDILPYGAPPENLTDNTIVERQKNFCASRNGECGGNDDIELASPGISNQNNVDIYDENFNQNSRMDYRQVATDDENTLDHNLNSSFILSNSGIIPIFHPKEMVLPYNLGLNTRITNKITRKTNT